MATHGSIRAWKIPWTEEPGGLQSMGSQRDRTEHSTAVCIQLGSPASGKRLSGLDSRLGVALGSPPWVFALGPGLRRWWLILLWWIIKAHEKKCKPGKYSHGICHRVHSRQPE